VVLQIVDSTPACLLTVFDSLAAELPMAYLLKMPTGGAAMDHGREHKRWQELAEMASTENDPARLIKLMEELLAELNRLKEQKRDCTVESL
jgi:hypothetical protein